MSFCVKFVVFLMLNELAFISCVKDDNFTFLISGGYRPTQHTLAKYIVSLQHRGTDDNFGYRHYCAGSILSPRIILTAAHCVWDTKKKRNIPTDSIQIVAGTPKRLKESPHTQIAYAKRITSHSRYYPNSINNDVAVIHLESILTLDEIHAQAIAITDTEPQAGQKCTVAGWGTLFVKGPIANDCLYADLVILKKECTKIYNKLARGMLCAGSIEDPETDSCQGDSGGPLICDDIQYGIVSFGTLCGRYPGVYANVFYYRDWIRVNGQDALKIEILLILSLLLVWIM